MGIPIRAMRAFDIFTRDLELCLTFCCLTGEKSSRKKWRKGRARDEMGKIGVRKKE